MDLKNYKLPSWYKPPSLIYRLTWIIVSLVFFESGFPFGSGVYRSLLRAFGSNIGKGVVIKPGVKIKYPLNLSIGPYSWIGEKVWIDNLDKVTIGSNCCISQAVYLLTGNHDFKKIHFDLLTSPITISDEVWLGAFSKVAPGTSISKSTVIGMGLFVKGKIEGDDEEITVLSQNQNLLSKKKYLKRKNIDYIKN